jgi:hypothetical protein
MHLFKLNPFMALLVNTASHRWSYSSQQQALQQNGHIRANGNSVTSLNAGNTDAETV